MTLCTALILTEQHKSFPLTGEPWAFIDKDAHLISYEQMCDPAKRGIPGRIFTGMIIAFKEENDSFRGFIVKSAREKCG